MTDRPFKVNRIVDQPPAKDGDKWFTGDFKEKLDKVQFEWNTQWNPLTAKDYLHFTLKMPIELVFPAYQGKPMSELQDLMKTAVTGSERLLAIAVYIRKLEQLAQEQINNAKHTST